MRNATAALLALVWLAAGACAQDEPAGMPEFLKPVPVHCAPGEALWASPASAINPEYSDPAKNGWQKYQGALTATWSCRVKGRLLVVRFYATHPVYACSAVENVFVSAWVDGVKLFTREDAGEAAECLGGSMLRSLTLRADGSVELCTFTWKEPYAEVPEKSCTRRSARDIGKLGRDPHYVPPGTVTPWAYDLRRGDPAFCTPFTAHLTQVPWNNLAAPDPAFAGQAVPGTENWMNAEVEEAYGEGWDGTRKSTHPPLTAEFDADNDGFADTVTLYSVWKKEGRVMAALAWQRKGAGGKPFLAGEIFMGRDGTGILDTKTYMSGMTAQVVRPVRLGGRTYLYARRHQAYDSDDGSEGMVMLRESPQAVVRGLIELHPDGTSTLVCGWGPRPRPEEFL